MTQGAYSSSQLNKDRARVVSMCRTVSFCGKLSTPWQWQPMYRIYLEILFCSEAFGGLGAFEAVRTVCSLDTSSWSLRISSICNSRHQPLMDVREELDLLRFSLSLGDACLNSLDLSGSEASGSSLMFWTRESRSNRALKLRDGGTR